MQRKAYSGSRGASLRAKEDKARDHWWQCEQGRSKKKKANKKTKKSAYSHMKGAQVKSSKANKITAGIPFKNSQVIVVNSKYQGKKKQAWHQYYQQPRKCQRPQSLSEFAFCSENKQTQRIDFEQQYRQSKPLF